MLVAATANARGDARCNYTSRMTRPTSGPLKTLFLRVPSHPFQRAISLGPIRMAAPAAACMPARASRRRPRACCRAAVLRPGGSGGGSQTTPTSVWCAAPAPCTVTPRAPPLALGIHPRNPARTEGASSHTSSKWRVVDVPLVHRNARVRASAGHLFDVTWLAQVHRRRLS